MIDQKACKAMAVFGECILEYQKLIPIEIKSLTLAQEEDGCCSVAVILKGCEQGGCFKVNLTRSDFIGFGTGDLYEKSTIKRLQRKAELFLLHLKSEISNG